LAGYSVLELVLYPRAVEQLSCEHARQSRHISNGNLEMHTVN